MCIRFLRSRHPAVVLVALLCACDAPLDPPARAFAESCQAHPHEFSLATAAIELRSGRLLVIDAIDQRLISLDFGLSSSAVVGTRGEGPLEYRAPSSLLRIADDSVLMFDRPNGRFLVLDGSGAITGSLKVRTDGIRVTNSLRVALLARESDRYGRLYMEAPALTPDGTPDPRIALRYVLRLDRGTDVVDTVAQLAGPDGYLTVERSGNDIRMTQGFASPYLPHDGWTVTDQGSVIVARASDYHIEFHHDDGTATVGPAIAYDASETTRCGFFGNRISCDNKSSTSSTRPVIEYTA